MDARLDLREVLEEAQARGLIGPGPLNPHLDHSRAWAARLGPAPDSFLDLGSGGGLPGLVLALEWPGSRATLLDSRRRSESFLKEAIDWLGLADRVRVVRARAEAAGRDPKLREAFPLVVARGFGSPAVTAECGGAFVPPGGRLSVSEPPGSDSTRWPPDQLEVLGLHPAETLVADETSFVVLEKAVPLEDRWPRRIGQPQHRPLWS